jgi:L-cysteine:1D-myo-inositol 2-amino-2-deoxy-alpha-D-glucopyranoside ligase
MAIRLALISEHYRADRSWTDDLLKAGERRLALWRSAAALRSGPAAAPVLAAVRAALADDLDTPLALSHVDAWAEAALSSVGSSDADPSAPGLVAETVDALLGVAL